MDIKERYISKQRRDARAKELKTLGYQGIFRSTAHGARLHPEYIKDAHDEGITYQTGFGNTDYMRTWKRLYTIEADRSSMSAYTRSLK